MARRKKFVVISTSLRSLLPRVARLHLATKGILTTIIINDSTTTGLLLHDNKSHRSRLDRFKTKEIISIPYMGTMSSSPSPSPSPLLSLPAELLAAIFANLSREDLYVVNLTSKFCRQLAAPLIWKHVDLVDCRAVTSPVTGQRIVSYGPGSASHSGRGIPAGASVSGDEHDDMPIIKKLWVLATYVDFFSSCWNLRLALMRC